MEALDWGQITPESYNTATKVVTHVFNHDLSSDEKIDRTIRFITGRLHYFDHHLPEDSKHDIKIDVRGQQLSEKTPSFIQHQIITRYTGVSMVTVELLN